MFVMGLLVGLVGTTLWLARREARRQRAADQEYHALWGRGPY